MQLDKLIWSLIEKALHYLLARLGFILSKVEFYNYVVLTHSHPVTG